MAQSEDRCECCDLPVWMCTSAKQKADAMAEAIRKVAERHQMTSISGSFPAKWPGKCPQCGEWFKEGTLIVALDDADEYRGPSWVCCGFEEESK